MSNIPKLRFPEFSGEWEEKKLGDCLTLLYGKDWKDKSSTKKLYPVLGTGGVISYIDEFIYDKPCVLIGRKGSINNPVFIDKPFWTVDTQFYSEIHEGYSPKFLYYIFCTENWSKHDESTGVPSLSAKNVENTYKHIPSYSEQQKIADFLSNVDSIITTETKILNTLQKKKKALMQKLFTQQLRFKSEDGTNFPAWEEKKMSDICSVNQGLQIAIENRLLEKKANCYFYITNEFIKTGTKYKYYIENPPKNVLCTKDDILMTRTGNTGIVVTDIDGCFHNNFFKINYSRDLVIKGFLIQFFKLSTTQKRILVLAGSSTIPDLNHKDFYSLTIQLPCKAEQQKIADCLSSLDSLIQTQQKVVTTWQQRKKALLQQMFI